MDMQAEYPKRVPTPTWDPVRVTYPVRKFPETGLSSETIGREWRSAPEVLLDQKTPLLEIKEYMRDYNITKELTQSQRTIDFGYKAPDTKRFNKHTSCTENQYVNHQPRRIAERPPQCTAFSSSEMKRSYTPPSTAPRLVTDKDQFKHPASLPPDDFDIEPSWHKDLPPLDTTHDGFEKLLDPYLTTSRLHHRPFTADQLRKQSATKDVITYYTLSNEPWIRSPKPRSCNLPLSKPKSMYDREKFKEDLREIRTHNRQQWIPSAFRTETRDNYGPQSVRLSSHVEHLEADVRRHYHRLVSPANANASAIANANASASASANASANANAMTYRKEYEHIGTGRAVRAVIDQGKAQNKRLQMKEMLRR